MTGDTASIRCYGLLWLWLFGSLLGSRASDTPAPLPLSGQQALLMFDGGHLESGSGMGPSFPYPSGPPQPAPAFDTSGSPSLVTARCWNNFEASEDCRDLNVITDDNQPGRKPDQENPIITPRLVYDGWAGPATQSQSVGVDEGSDGPTLTPPSTSNDVYPMSTTDTELTTDSYTVGPVWQLPDELPSSTRTIALAEGTFFGTPKPMPGKSSTTSRVCRDQNDADCDEPEEDTPGSEPGLDDEADEEQRAVEEKGTKTGQELDLEEQGSGQGSPDDTDNDGDDDADQPESAGVWDMNVASSSLAPGSNIQPAGHTTPSSGIDSRSNFTFMPLPDTTAPPVSHGAEIEVVVHPMMPPTFSKSTPFDWPPTQAPTMDPPRPQTTSTTTIIPDDTYKSKPVFPSTSKPAGPVDNQQATEWSATDNDLDLATFKSVPIGPVSEAEPGIQRILNADSSRNSSSAANDNQQQVADRHRFESVPLKPQSAGSAKFESAWLEKPQRSTHSNNGAPLNRPTLYEPMASNQQSTNLQPVSIRRSSEMLPTLLVIASVLIFLAAMVVLVMMALWRRNMNRQRALILSKSGLMNGPSGLFPIGQVGHHQMVTSLNRPAGLLSTYAPSLANKIGTSIVHREPADDQQRLTTFGETGREDGGTCDNSNNSQQSGSTTTDNDETTSSGAGSLETSAQAPIRTRLDDNQSVGDVRPPIQHQPTNRHASRQQYLSDSLAHPQPALFHPQQPMYPDHLTLAGRAAFLGPGAPSMQYHQEQHQMLQPSEVNQMRGMSLSRSVEALDQYQQHSHQLTTPNHNTMGRPGRPHDPLRLPALGYGPAYGLPEPPYLNNNSILGPILPPPPSPGPQSMNALMNPSGGGPATRMGHHHLARAPYSTDSSSSFVTVSPSLARTSSSSSFLLTNGPPPASIQPKPLVDAAGRMFNSYAPSAAHFGGPAEPAPSFVSGAGSRRPEVSEPWYV